ncbi:MAG: oligosaccharide flippase family protein [Bacteroidaceae bacterium]|nr:oligosaccharide flippase family protein [Bacteroidaceae bacterium]
MDLKKYKQLIENFFSLSILNALNVLLPLVTLPYILHVVGKANYGAYSYVYVVLQYVILFSTYGFNFSATKLISQNREDKHAVSRIYSAVIACKSIIAVVLSLVLLLFSRLVFKDEIGLLMFFYGLGMVVGDIFTPVWLFQGMEKMKYMTIVNASSKILFTILIFIVVRTRDDYSLLILLNSFGYLLAGLLSIVLVYKQFHIRLCRTTWGEILTQLKDGSAVFGSTFGMNLYRNANVIILKQFVPDDIVGVYSAAEKVIKGFQSLISPAAQALFPHLSHRFKGQSVKNNMRLLRRIAFPFTAVVVLVTIGVYIFAPIISDILCGSDFTATVPLIRIMTLVILFGEINYLVGIVGLINMDGQTLFFRSVIITGIFSVIFMLLSTSHWGAIAAAWAMSLSEMLLFVLCLWNLYQINKRA